MNSILSWKLIWFSNCNHIRGALFPGIKESQAADTPKKSTEKKKAESIQIQLKSDADELILPAI